MTQGFEKCVTQQEMARIEQLAIAAGSKEIDFMEQAGCAIASAIIDLIATDDLKKGIALFAGTGNNGADGFVAARHLLKKGFVVEAFHIKVGQKTSPLCLAQMRRFIDEGGVCIVVDEEKKIPSRQHPTLIDALVGTGFTGKAEGLLAAAIHAINASYGIKFSVDIPSGLSGTFGLVETIAVHADYTVYLELPKIGFFINAGWDHVGILIQAKFGMPPEFIDQAVPSAILPHVSHIASLLPKMKRSRHKYQAGYVVAYAGSAAMAGAALLAASSALHAGAGIVRLFHPQGMQHSLPSFPAEIIKEELKVDDPSPLGVEIKKASAVLLGPGLGRTKEVEKTLQYVLNNITSKCVIDADALVFLARHPTVPLPQKCIFTPHHGEMAQLLGSFVHDRQNDLLSTCWQYAHQKNITLILKGAPTIIFTSDMPPMIMPYGDPGMATAGCGDVLTGIIAAMLSQGLSPKEAAIVSVYLHGKAGEMAALQKTSFGTVASDIITFLPYAFKFLCSKRQRVGK